MAKGIPVVDGNWREAITEAVKRRHERHGEDAVVTIISPTTKGEAENETEAVKKNI